MYFIAFSILVLVMQFLHWDLLIQVFPDRCRRWIPWGLVVAHLPLVAFMIFRVTGHAGEGMGSVLGPLARVALYFQLFTVVNLVFWGLALGIWKVRRRMGHSIDRGPEDPGRRAFLRKTAAGGIGIMAAASASGADEAYGDPEVTRTVLWFADLPMGLDGLRIVHLTDLHCGPLVGGSLVKRWRLLAERDIDGAEWGPTQSALLGDGERMVGVGRKLLVLSLADLKVDSVSFEPLYLQTGAALPQGDQVVLEYTEAIAIAVEKP